MAKEKPLTEAAARAALAAGKPLPLAWLWLLGAERIEVTNPRESGKTMKVRITDDATEPPGR